MNRSIFLPILFILTLSLVSPTITNPNSGITISEYGYPTVWGMEVTGQIQRGDTWEREYLGDGKYKINFGQPEFLLDSDGNYKPYIISTNSTHINIDSLVTPLSFNKTDATKTIYEKGTLIKDNPSPFIGKQYWSMVTNSGSGWNLYDILQLDVDYTTQKTEDGRELTINRHHAKAEFTEVTTLHDDGSLTKPVLTLVNNGAYQPPILDGNGTEITPEKLKGFENIKVSFADVWEDVSGIKGIKFDDGDEMLKGSALAQKFPVDTPVTITKSEILQKAITFKTLNGDTFIYDTTLGFDDLVALQVTRNADNTANIIWVYGKPTNIQLGDVITLDPTFGYTTATGWNQVTDPSCNGTVGADLDPSWTGANSGPTNCYSVQPYWDISSIDDTVTIHSVKINVDTIQTGGVQTCTIRSMEGNVSTQSDQENYDDMNDGTDFITSNTSFCQGGAQSDVIVDLGDDAVADLQSELAIDNEWGIGVDYDLTTSSTYVAYVANTSAFQLEIVYSTLIAHQVPTLDTVSQVADTSSLTISWTEDVTNFDNATQPVKSNSTLWTGETKELYQPLHNWNATQETGIGAIDTSSNFEGLFHFDTLYTSNELGIANFTDYSGDDNHALVTPLTLTYTEVLGVTPLLHFDFSDANGVTNQGSGGSSYDGTNDGATTGATGKRDEAYDFDGSNDSVEVTPKVTSDNSDWTVTGWFDTDQVGTYKGIVNQIESGFNQEDFSITLTASGTIDCWKRTDGTTNDADKVTSTTTVSTGQFYYFACVYDDSVANDQADLPTDALKLYINGVLEDNTPADSIFNGQAITHGFEIGEQGASFFDGTIDEVAVFSSALTDSEVLASMNLAGTTTIKSSHIDSDLSNEIQLIGSSLNVTSTSYPELQQEWTMQGIITLNQTTSFPLMSWGSDAGEVLINIDDSFLALSVGGTDIFNFTKTMTQGNAQAISISRTLAGVYEVLWNGTGTQTVTDTTSLGTVTDDLYFIGTDSTLTNSGTWRLDEFSVQSVDQSTQDNLDFGFRIVPLTILESDITGTSTTDATVGFEDSQCYAVSTGNTVTHADDSVYSNIVCGTSDAEAEAEAGGGGGGSSGSSSATSNVISAVDDLLTLSILDNSHIMTIDDFTSDSIPVSWDSNQEIRIDSIEWDNAILDSIKFVIEEEGIPLTLLPLGDNEEFSTNEIEYSITTPSLICNPNASDPSERITGNCMYNKIYELPLTITAISEGNESVSMVTITIDTRLGLGGQTLALISIFIMVFIAGVGIIQFSRRHSRHKGHKGKNNRNHSSKPTPRKPRKHI